MPALRDEISGGEALESQKEKKEAHGGRSLSQTLHSAFKF
jgi:hypothetical protein